MRRWSGRIAMPVIGCPPTRTAAVSHLWSHSNGIPMTPPAIRNQRIDFLRNFRKGHIFILFDRAIWVTRRSGRSSTLWCCGILLRCVLILLLVRGPITCCERQSNQNQESRYQNSRWLHFYFLLLFDDSLTHGNNFWVCGANVIPILFVIDFAAHLNVIDVNAALFAVANIHAV